MKVSTVHISIDDAGNGNPGRTRKEEKPMTSPSIPIPFIAVSMLLFPIALSGISGWIQLKITGN